MPSNLTKKFYKPSLFIICISLFSFIYTTPIEAAINDGLVSFWGLNETTGTRDDNIGTNDLTPNGSVSNTTGKVGSAAQFDNGASGYLQVANNSSLNMNGGDFSISLWVYLDNRTGTQVFASKYSSSGYAVYYEPLNSAFIFSTYSGGGVTIGSSLGNPNTGTWYNIVGVHDSVANTNTIRINDQYENTNTSVTDQADTAAAFLIGAFGGSGQYKPNARIDAVGLWNRKLTAQEITDLYASGNGLELTNAPTPTPTPSPSPTSTPGSQPTTQPSSASPSAPSCQDTQPTETNLFQIDVTNTQVTLYYTPAKNANKYYIGYGNNQNTEQYGVEFNTSNSTGVIAYTINHLSPSTVYSFKVRAGNGCMPGNWSNTMQISTTPNNTQGTSYYRNLTTRILSIIPKHITQTQSTNHVLGTNDAMSNCSTYTVKSGDNLWNISSQNLGNGSLYPSIMDANKLSSKILQVGQTLKINCN